MRRTIANPSVSVIVPNYNRAEDLRRCLNSLVAQTFDNFEVLICDDGSTDASRHVASEFVCQLDLSYETDRNFGGPARPRNRGIAKARAPYIAFLDVDDWWRPDKLARCVAVLDAGADIVYHDLYLAHANDQATRGRRIQSTPPQHPMFEALLCTGISIPNSSAVVRRELLARMGGISEDLDLISVEDYDTWIRLSRLTERFVRVDECLGYYWVGGGNISSASPKQIFRIKALYARYLDELRPARRRQAEGFLSYRVGKIALSHGDFGTAIKSLLDALRHPIEPAYRAKASYHLLISLFHRKFP